LIAGFEPGQNHSIMSDLRFPRKPPIARLGNEHRVDHRLRRPETLLGLVHLTEIIRGGHALHARHSNISISDVQSKPGVTAYFRGQPTQVFQRRVDDQLSCLRGARCPADLRIDVEELVRQLAHLNKSPLGNGALAIGQPEARGKSGNGKRDSRRGQPVPPE
jgi:hypothetical protein